MRPLVYLGFGVKKSDLKILGQLKHPILIAVDQGLQYCIGPNFNSSVDYWVGDQDSFDFSQHQALLISNPPRRTIKLKIKKNHSDLEMAIHKTLRFWKNEAPVYFLGFQGGRMDHEWLVWNVIEHFALRFRKHISHVTWTGRRGDVRWLLRKSSVRFNLPKGEIFSVFSAPASAFLEGVEILGASRFKVRQKPFVSLGHGLSNVSLGGEIVINCRKGPLCVVIPRLNGNSNRSS